MRRLAVTCAALMLAALSVSAAPKTIDGLEAWAWKQRGSAPITLTFYDATQDPQWRPVIEEAVALWNASPAFDLRYVRMAGPDPSIDFYHGSGNVYVFEGERVVSYITSPRGLVDHASISLVPTSLIGPLNIPPGWDLLKVLRHYIRHEMGHVLGVAHHSDLVRFGAVENDQCAMAFGIQVTAFDLALLCQRYRCGE